DGDQAAEMHRDVFDRKDDFPGHGARAHRFASPGSELPAQMSPASAPLDCVRLAIQPCTVGTMPRGRTNTTRIVRPPYRIHCTAGAANGRTITGRKPKMRPPTTGPASDPLPPVITMITIVTV